MVKETIDDTTRIENTIGHVKLFASDQKNKVIEEFNINDIIISTLNLIKRQYIKDDIEIECNLDDKISLIKGNPFNFEQVILNLMSNSRDALDQKSKNLRDNFKKKIIITSLNNNKEIILKIEDNGIGIPLEAQSEIFHPFFTTKELGKGIGLGLSIVSGIVKEINGKIDFESQSEKGTIMTIKIPITE
jgi:C4-dicarboxylate-specific signal transduction histidine kinase